MRAIAQGLKGLKDPDTGEPVVNNVYFREDIFSGPYMNNAPDLFVGFNAGYRASWQTALGEAPDSLIEANRKKWSGDHLIDPILVPGIIFINKNFELKEVSILDITPTLFDWFGIPNSHNMSGKALRKKGASENLK